MTKLIRAALQQVTNNCYNSSINCNLMTTKYLSILSLLKYNEHQTMQHCNDCIDHTRENNNATQLNNKYLNLIEASRL